VLFVGNVWDGTVSLIDAGTLHVIKTLNVEPAHGRGKMVLDFNPKGPRGLEVFDARSRARRRSPPAQSRWALGEDALTVVVVLGLGACGRCDARSQAHACHEPPRSRTTRVPQKFPNCPDQPRLGGFGARKLAYLSQIHDR
jgi:YVTN family beta-propeller protein